MAPAGHGLIEAFAVRAVKAWQGLALSSLADRFLVLVPRPTLPGPCIGNAALNPGIAECMQQVGRVSFALSFAKYTILSIMNRRLLSIATT